MGFRRSLVRIQSPRHRKSRRDNQLRRLLLLHLEHGRGPYPPHTRLTTEGGYGHPGPSGFPGRPSVPLEGLNMSARPQRKPWFHAPSGFWCAQLQGKRHYLDRDPAVAQRKLKQLLQDQRRGDAAKQQRLGRPFSDLADEFLDHVQACQKPATYRGYREMLELAMTHLGTGLVVGSVCKHHLNKLKQALTGPYSPTTVFKALHAVQRVFAWAVASD